MDLHKAVQASSLQVHNTCRLAQARSKNYSDWIRLDLDRPGPDCTIAGLLESLTYLLPDEEFMHICNSLNKSYDDCVC